MGFGEIIELYNDGKYNLRSQRILFKNMKNLNGNNILFENQINGEDLILM